MNFYVETSAIVRTLFREQSFGEIAHKLDHAEKLITSRLSLIEVDRAIIRRNALEHLSLVHSSELKKEWRLFFSRIDIIEISASICDQARTIFADLPLRTLDAIHVATYLEIKGRFPQLQMLSVNKRIMNCLN